MSKVATLEEARALARDVAVACMAFNAVVRAARQSGLVVEIDTVDMTKVGDKWPQREFFVKTAVDL